MNVIVSWVLFMSAVYVVSRGKEVYLLYAQPSESNVVIFTFGDSDERESPTECVFILFSD